VLRHRAEGEEFIDRPDADPDLVRRSHTFMRGVNGLFGGTRVVRRFVADMAHGSGPTHVLDLGSGTCDIPLKVRAWARRRGLDVRITCVESDRHACAAARGHLERAGDSAVSLVEASVWEYEPDEHVDCVVGSMFFHHLRDDEVLKLLARVRGFGADTVLINDLRRSWGAYIGCWLWALGVPRQVRHDGLLSVRRGFRAHELQALLDRLPDASATVTNAWLFRVAAVVRFQRRGAA
jgi:hypothetical protein